MTNLSQDDLDLCVQYHMWVDPRNGMVRFIEEMGRKEIREAIKLTKPFEDVPQIKEIIDFLEARIHP